jgi:hypothetical protein
MDLLCGLVGACGNVVIKALCYKPEGHGFKTPTRGMIFFFNLPNPSSWNRPWRSFSL